MCACAHAGMTARGPAVCLMGKASAGILTAAGACGLVGSDRPCRSGLLKHASMCCCCCVHGCSFEGLWKAGRKEGRGTFTFANGTTYSGKFQDDKVVGTGALLRPPNPGGWPALYESSAVWWLCGRHVHDPCAHPDQRYRVDDPLHASHGCAQDPLARRLRQEGHVMPAVSHGASPPPCLCSCCCCTPTL